MKLYTLILALFLGLTSQAQNNQLRGELKSESAEAIAYATIVLMTPNDSIMKYFAISKDNGSFEIQDIKSGNYLLQITMIGFKKYDEIIDIQSSIQLPTVTLLEETVLLDGVDIKAEASPIRLNNDTLEYNADAFHVQATDKVEDLLKKLPGVEVNGDGSIKAQGEEVTKILVDGKEFFGDDTKIATKNLPADAIKSIQVYDKSSDMSEFTGVDDGERIKTINLVLKEGKKHGYFGNMTGGYGTPNDRYEGKLNLNQFSKKSQLSLIGMSNNINDQAFSLSDYSNFMGGFRNLMESGLASWGSGGPSLNNSIGDGITTSLAGGLNYNFYISKKTEFISSYFYNKIGNIKNSQSTREYFNNNSNFNTETDANEDSNSDNHRLNYKITHEFNPLMDLKLTGNATYNNGGTSQSNDIFSRNSEDIIENQNNSINIGDGSNYGLNNSLMLRRKLGTSGRSVVANGKFNISKDDRGIDLTSINSFPVIFTSDTLSQHQNYNKEQQTYSAEIRYTEPIGKQKFLELSLETKQTETNLDKEFLDVDLSGEEFLNTTLSNKYNNIYSYYNESLKFKFNKEKYNFTLGLAAQQSQLNSELISLDTSINRSFNNLLPSFRYDYRFKNSKRLHLSYKARVNEPSIEQLQPILDNSNPLQIYVGNPDLGAEYEHSVRARFVNFNQFSFTSLFAHLRASYTSNKITNSVSIDSLFVQTTQPINVDHEFQVSASVSYDAPIRPLKIKFGITPSSSLNKGFLFVNGMENASDRLVNSLNFKIENRKKDFFDLTVGTKLSQNITLYSENDQLNQEFFTQNIYIDLSKEFKKGWEFDGSFDINRYYGKSFDSEQVIPLLKASVSKIILNKKGIVKLSVFDALDQNVGYNRNSSFNYIDEIYSNSLSRYYMLSFTYSLSELGKKEGGNWYSKFDKKRK